ncbi:ATP-binding cassette domain-containing protein, partial [Azospirillum brasilense]|nr:ATP-binding cassette domain-containing protein [Azospirillum brasilense]
MEAPAMSFVSIEQAGYGVPSGGTILDRIDWTIGEGEFHALVGRSGCGKTTLLKLVGCWLPPRTGQDRIRGAPGGGPWPTAGSGFRARRLL